MYNFRTTCEEDIFAAVCDKMCGVLAVVIIVQLMSGPNPVLGDEPTSDIMLSKSLASEIESWTSPLVNPVVVYREFDVDVPCVENDKIDDSKHTMIVSNNKSFVWLDNDNKTVRPVS